MQFEAINAPEDPAARKAIGFVPVPEVTDDELLARYGLRVPQFLNHYPVIAAIRLPDVSGFLPQRHIAVCRMSSKGTERDHGENQSHVVWECAWQQGFGWTCYSGSHDLSAREAIKKMYERAEGSFTS